MKIKVKVYINLVLCKQLHFVIETIIIFQQVSILEFWNFMKIDGILQNYNISRILFATLLFLKS